MPWHRTLIGDQVFLYQVTRLLTLTVRRLSPMGRGRCEVECGVRVETTPRMYDSVALNDL